MPAGGGTTAQRQLALKIAQKKQARPKIKVTGRKYPGRVPNATDLPGLNRRTGEYFPQYIGRA